MSKTKIEWTTDTWNPTTGCDQVSPGCDHCYAMTMAKRLKGMGQPDYQTDGDPRTSGPGFGLAIHPHRLDQPLRWKKPRKVFVNSMSDLFHDAVPAEHIASVFAVMHEARQHTFQILTKRHARMRALLSRSSFAALVADRLVGYGAEFAELRTWPLPNVWLGVSVENQKWADIRIPALLDTPAAVRFLSCEPLLGPITFRWAQWAPLRDAGHLEGLRGIDWVIVGGESGHSARPMHPNWARSIRDQCTAAGVAFHFKQWGEWAPQESDEACGSRPCGYLNLDATAALYSHRNQPGVEHLARLGKHAAGRELDGRTWDEYPAVVS